MHITYARAGVCVRDGVSVFVCVCVLSVCVCVSLTVLCTTVLNMFINVSLLLLSAIDLYESSICGVACHPRFSLTVKRFESLTAHYMKFCIIFITHLRFSAASPKRCRRRHCMRKRK